MSSESQRQYSLRELTRALRQTSLGWNVGSATYSYVILGETVNHSDRAFSFL